jgi:hypothetical protein
VVVSGGDKVVEYSTVATIPGWLSANPVTGSAPNGSLPGFSPSGGAWLNVMVNPSGLTAGTYTVRSRFMAMGRQSGIPIFP